MSRFYHLWFFSLRNYERHEWIWQRKNNRTINDLKPHCIHLGQQFTRTTAAFSFVSARLNWKRNFCCTIPRIHAMCTSFFLFVWFFLFSFQSLQFIFLWVKNLSWIKRRKQLTTWWSGNQCTRVCVCVCALLLLWSI